MKQARWYEVIGDRLRVYDQPIPAKAIGMSDVPNDKASMAYYRNTFDLKKVWQSSDATPL